MGLFVSTHTKRSMLTWHQDLNQYNIVNILFAVPINISEECDVTESPCFIAEEKDV